MRTGALATLLLAVGLLAGCGGGGAKSNGEASKAAQQVLADTKQAALAATGVHVSGSIVTEGTPLTVDLHIVRGKGGAGSMSEGGLRFDVIRIGGTAYIKGSDAFYKKFAGEAAAQLLHGKWLKGSATSGQLASLVPLTDIDKLFAGVTGGHGTLVNDGATTFQGQKVVAIRDSTKGGTLYVAATGTPYPVGLKGEKQTGTVTFDHWNDTVAIVAPKGAIDISKLG